MNRWLTFVGVLMVLGIIAILIFLLSINGGPARANIGLSYTPPQHGHMGNFYSSNFRVALVTNFTRENIVLDNPWSEREERGITLSDMAVMWGGTNYYSSLIPNAVMPIPFEAPTNSAWFRVCFRYNRAGGVMQRIAAPLVRKIFGPRWASPWLVRLSNSGWQDGRLHFTYEGNWQTNELISLTNKSQTHAQER